MSTHANDVAQRVRELRAQFGDQLQIATASAGETKAMTIDLVETLPYDAANSFARGNWSAAC
jgi:hypothetical protein